MTKVEIIFIPATGIGHLKSAVEFAKCLINRHDQLSITILVMKELFTSHLASYIKSISLKSSESRIKLIQLPQVDLPPLELLSSPENYICHFVENHKPIVRDIFTNTLSSSKADSNIIGVFLDFFCVSMIDIANEFNLPSYLFFTSNAGFLGLTMYLPFRHEKIGTEFHDSATESLIPSFINPVPSSVLPSALFDGNGGYTAYLKLAQRFRETRGIVVNTFSELENHALNSFSDGQTPPIYAVGPLIDLKGNENHPDLKREQRDKILKWLDDQPPSSVVFLCFGSMGSFNEDQVKEIAVGLERSEHRFLWSIRMATGASPKDSERQEILPKGFMKRIEGKGMICGWTPQVEVLGHESIGGFVSHCGWNSILESLWFGVPIVTWPMYAEQQLNAFRMVKELAMAVELRLDYYTGGGDVVAAEEIERAVRCLMERGSEVRRKVEETGGIGRKSVMDGGSSFMAIGRLIEDMMSSVDSLPGTTVRVTGD